MAMTMKATDRDDDDDDDDDGGGDGGGDDDDDDFWDPHSSARTTLAGNKMSNRGMR